MLLLILWFPFESLSKIGRPGNVRIHFPGRRIFDGFSLANQRIRNITAAPNSSAESADEFGAAMMLRILWFAFENPLEIRRPRSVQTFPGMSDILGFNCISGCRDSIWLVELSSRAQRVIRRRGAIWLLLQMWCGVKNGSCCAISGKIFCNSKICCAMHSQI